MSKLNTVITTHKHKLLSKYTKPYNLGDDVCIVSFYRNVNGKKEIITLEELSKGFRQRKLKCADVTFDVKHIKVSEEYEFNMNKFGYVGFNETPQSLLIAYNRYPKYDDLLTSKHLWNIIAFEEYFKENPTVNLEYVDYKYAVQYMSVTPHIPKNITKVLSIVVNNYLGNRHV